MINYPAANSGDGTTKDEDASEMEQQNDEYGLYHQHENEMIQQQAKEVRERLNEFYKSKAMLQQT